MRRMERVIKFLKGEGILVVFFSLFAAFLWVLVQNISDMGWSLPPDPPVEIIWALRFAGVMAFVVMVILMAVIHRLDRRSKN